MNLKELPVSISLSSVTKTYVVNLTGVSPGKFQAEKFSFQALTR